MSSAEDSWKSWKFLPLDDPAMRNFFGFRYNTKNGIVETENPLGWTSPAAGSSKSSTSELQTL
jgi:hypothetical protein